METYSKFVFVLSLKNNCFCIDSIEIPKKHCMHDNIIYDKIWEKIINCYWDFQKWIQINPILQGNPIIISPTSNIDIFIEILMWRYGPNRVRGGAYKSVLLDHNELKDLRYLLFNKKIVCNRCGKNCKTERCQRNIDRWGIPI